MTVMKFNIGAELKQLMDGLGTLFLKLSSLNVTSLSCLFSKRWLVGGSRFFFDRKFMY